MKGIKKFLGRKIACGVGIAVAAAMLAVGIHVTAIAGQVLSAFRSGALLITSTWTTDRALNVLGIGLVVAVFGLLVLGLCLLELLFLSVQKKRLAARAASE